MRESDSDEETAAPSRKKVDAKRTSGQYSPKQASEKESKKSSDKVPVYSEGEKSGNDFEEYDPEEQSDAI